MRGARIAIVSLLVSLSLNVYGFDYALKPQKIAENTYVVIGATDDFSVANGGNIVNTAFVVTEAGVVVIDTGPTKLYGEQLRRAIGAITKQPIARVFITHAHPDHYLGSQAFSDVGVFALPRATQMATAQGSSFADNLYRLVLDAAKGTENVPPTQSVTVAELRVGNHRFALHALTGHTAGDLAIFDATTGVLFTGDLVFHNRTPATPHASVAEWLNSLDTLERLPFKILVPGHGAPASDARALVQTRDYLRWLDRTLGEAARMGRDMSDLLAMPQPSAFSTLRVFRSEFQRSLAHLFPRYEAAALK
jgi:quinoprotein relay system zinc metallohydrolase 1